MLSTCHVYATFNTQMIYLWRDPKGERIFTTTQRESTDTSRITDKTKISQLEKEIMSLKQQLDKSCPSQDAGKIMHHFNNIALILDICSRLQTLNNNESCCCD